MRQDWSTISINLSITLSVVSGETFKKIGSVIFNSFTFDSIEFTKFLSSSSLWSSLSPWVFGEDILIAI